MIPTNCRNPSLAALLIVGMLRENAYQSSAFTTAIPQTKLLQVPVVLHLSKSQGQGGSVCTMRNNPPHVSKQQLHGKGASEFDRANIMTRRDSLLRGMGLAFGVALTTTFCKPGSAAAFFDYEGEKTGYTYSPPPPPPPPPVGVPSTTTSSSRDNVTAPLPENIEIPVTPQSTETPLPAIDESTPGHRDNYLVQSSPEQRTKEYQRLDYSIEPEDHYDGMYF